MNSRGLTRQTKASPRKFGEVGKRAKQARNARALEVAALEAKAHKLNNVARFILAFGLLTMIACFSFRLADMGAASNVSLIASALAMVPYFLLLCKVEKLYESASE